jgi:16S rRNA processing protein RimM
LSTSGSKTSGGAKKLCLGIITGVHGIHGEVVIKSYTENPLDIKSYGPLSDEGNERQFTVSKVRIAKKGVVARLKGIDDRNSAEALKGTGLFVEHARLPEPADEDEYYFTDLMGLKVVLADGSTFGTVTALHNFGAGDLIEIKPIEGKGSEVYPFDKKTVPEVDIKAGQITFNPPLMIENPEK